MSPTPRLDSSGSSPPPALPLAVEDLPPRPGPPPRDLRQSPMPPRSPLLDGRRLPVNPAGPVRPAGPSSPPRRNPGGHTGAAALCYFPLPGLAWLLARAHPHDRHVRFHSRQGGWLVAAAWLLLLAFGFLGPKSTALAVIGAILAVTIVPALLVGAFGAARGRFTRIRGVSDILVLASR